MKRTSSGLWISTLRRLVNTVARRLKGHQQWTGAVLLCHATQRDGVLVTFDAGGRELAGREFERRVLLLVRS